jgi:hypothetical protein
VLLYFAGPLFSEAEKHFNQQLTDKIEDLGYRVFLPQRRQKELRQPTKRILGLHTDVRVAFPGGALNTMVGVPLERVVHTEDALLELLREIRET